MKECTNCGYERQPKDEGIFPASECPKCHVIYDKIKDGDEGLEESVGELDYVGRITRYGLSFGARITLGFFAGLFGVLMLNLASQTDIGAVLLYMFGAFCLMIAIACVTKGRVRQFVGSLIGCAMFASALWIVGICIKDAYEVASGVRWSHSQSLPSVENALLFCVGFGLAGAAYAYKVRFGFRKQP